MRYVPNLIPDSVKVLPDYFKGDSYDFKQDNTALTVLSYIGTTCFFILAVLFIKHPYWTVLFGLLGFFILPQGHNLIEKTFRFRFTTKIKSVFCGLLFIGSIPLTIHYNETDKQEEKQLRIQQEKERQEKIEADKKEQQRIDSLNYYIQTATTLPKTKNMICLNLST